MFPFFKSKPSPVATVNHVRRKALGGIISIIAAPFVAIKAESAFKEFSADAVLHAKYREEYTRTLNIADKTNNQARLQYEIEYKKYEQEWDRLSALLKRNPRNKKIIAQIQGIMRPPIPLYTWPERKKPTVADYAEYIYPDLNLSRLPQTMLETVALNIATSIAHTAINDSDLIDKLRIKSGNASLSNAYVESVKNSEDFFLKDPLQLESVFIAPLLEESVMRFLPNLIVDQLLNIKGNAFIFGVPMALVFSLMHGISFKDEEDKKYFMFHLPAFFSGLYYWYLIRNRGFVHTVVAHSTKNFSIEIGQCLGKYREICNKNTHLSSK